MVLEANERTVSPMSARITITAVAAATLFFVGCGGGQPATRNIAGNDTKVTSPAAPDSTRAATTTTTTITATTVPTETTETEPALDPATEQWCTQATTVTLAAGLHIYIAMPAADMQTALDSTTTALTALTTTAPANIAEATSTLNDTYTSVQNQFAAAAYNVANVDVAAISDTLSSPAATTAREQFNDYLANTCDIDNTAATSEP